MKRISDQNYEKEVSMAVSPKEAGIIMNAEGEPIILLPPGPISGTVTGESGAEYNHVLVDSPDLGRPVGKIVPPTVVFEHP